MENAQPERLSLYVLLPHPLATAWGNVKEISLFEPVLNFQRMASLAGTIPNKNGGALSSAARIRRQLFLSIFASN